MARRPGPAVAQIDFARTAAYDLPNYTIGAGRRRGDGLRWPGADKGIPVRLSRFRRLRSRGFRAAVAGAVLLGVCSADALAQNMRVRTHGSRSYSGISQVGMVGNTSVARNFGQTTPGSTSRNRSTGSSYGQQSKGLGGRRVNPGRNPLLSSPAQSWANQRKNEWRHALAPSGAARYLRQPPDFRYFQDANAGPGGQQAHRLLNAAKLVETTAFVAPARLGGFSSGVIHDALSLADDTGQVRYSARPVVGPGKHTQAELMTSRLAALQKQSLADGWTWFQKGEYLRARSCFENAEMLKRRDAEPRAGVFFCMVAERKYMQALHLAARIYRLDAGPNLFGADYRLAERYEPLDVEDPEERRAIGKQRLLQDVRSFVKFSGENPSLVILAAQIFHLWHGDQRAEAVQAARILLKEDPTGPYGRLGAGVLEADRKRREAASG